MSGEGNGITIAGTLIADIFHEVDTYPSEGLLTTVRARSKNIGGTGNMILDLAKLDSELAVKVCAIVGDDEEGRFLCEKLGEYPNIDRSAITVEGRSAATLVMNAQDHRQRTFFVVPEANDRFDESYISWDKVDAKIFHLEYLLLMKKVDGYDSEYGTHGARILHDARERGMVTSIDVVSEQSDRAASVVTAALKYTDICCINEYEAYSVTGIKLTDEEGSLVHEATISALQKIRDAGVSRWIVIHAPHLSYGLDCVTGDVVAVPSLDLPQGYIKGSTGAGDAYCSGVLYGFYKDMTLTEAMKLARASAAASLSENNGTDGMRPYADVMRLGEIYPERVL